MASKERTDMQTFIGAKLLSSKLAPPAIKPFEIYDSRLAGFTLRVQPTGVRSYYARFGRIAGMHSARWALCGQTRRGRDVRKYLASSPVDPRSTRSRTAAIG